MIKDTLEYLKQFKDYDSLLEFLASLPAIRDAVKEKQINKFTMDAVRKIPNELLEKYYLATNFTDGVEEIKDWCKKNLEPAEMHFVFQKLQINSIRIKNIHSLSNFVHPA